MPYPIIFVLLMLLGISACTGLKTTENLVKTNVIKFGSVEVPLHPQAQDSIILHYIGCSGFLIQYGDQAVLHDPFFSNVGPLTIVPFKTLQSDTTLILSFFQSMFPQGKDEDGLVKLLLISHTHYDHMMDAPFIYERILNQDSVRMLGNKSMTKIMQLWQGEAEETLNTNIQSVEDHLTTANTEDSSFFSMNGKIRILPISTNHAPHFHLLHLFKGEVKAPKIKTLEKARKWKEGKNIAYLIDFLTVTGDVKFRIYISGSASNTPEGLIPLTVLKKHPVNLAILCAASHEYVRNYPKKIIQNIQPQHLIISHWEDFFHPLAELYVQPKAVPFTNIRKFLRKISEPMEGTADLPSWTMPNPGTKIVIRF